MQTLVVAAAAAGGGGGDGGKGRLRACIETLLCVGYRYVRSTST
jgi:hypothetical protein